MNSKDKSNIKSQISKVKLTGEGLQEALAKIDQAVIDGGEGVIQEYVKINSCTKRVTMYDIIQALLAERDKLAKRVEELEQVLGDLIWLYKTPDETVNECFERVGERFYKECGMLRPGKDEAAEVGISQEERRETFRIWADGFLGRARQVLKARAEEDSP